MSTSKNCCYGFMKEVKCYSSIDSCITPIPEIAEFKLDFSSILLLGSPANYSFVNVRFPLIDARGCRELRGSLLGRE